jgi:hypothetical protein
MKRTPAALGFAALVAALVSVAAQAPQKTDGAGTQASPAAAAPAKGPRKATTLRGEILDMSCYVARGLRGPMHRDCALKCIQTGVCMGMMGPDSMLYMLTVDHGRAMAPTSYTTPDPYALCKRWAGQEVEITGMAYERAGMTIIEVTRAKLLPAPPAAP